MNKTKKATTKAQLELLISSMKKEPSVARGFTKLPREQVQEFWNQLVEDPNNVGPPFKGSAEWKKVWTDYKAFVRKKLVNNKKNINATGGGPSWDVPLTELEEEVAMLLQLETTIDGISDKTCHGLTPADMDPSILAGCGGPPATPDDTCEEQMPSTSEVRKLRKEVSEQTVSKKELIDLKKEKLVELKRSNDLQEKKILIKMEIWELTKENVHQN